MAPSFHHWESDPLFSAAEVVQDSADRMNSIFRLLLHELSMVQGENSDPKLLASIDCHRRDLATILETTKWQLEDFQRAVTMSAMTEKSQTKNDVILRHRLFIQAMREQVTQVEKSLEDRSVGYPVRNNEWVNLNEEDRYGLALFLSGGSPSEQSGFDDSCNNGLLLGRYLDSTTATSAKDGALLNSERKISEIKTSNNTSMRSGFQTMSSLPETSRNGCVEEGTWDMEANEAEPRNVFQGSKSRRFQMLKIVRLFGHLWSTYGSRVARKYTKRLKDGDEQSESPSAADSSNDLQNCLGTCKASYHRLRHHIQLSRHSVPIISLIIFALLILGILVLQIA